MAKGKQEVPVLTLQEARTVKSWAKKHFGLDSWKIKFCYSDKEPEWAKALDNGGGRADCSVCFRTLSVWVGPTQCKMEERDPLHTIFHEMCHASFEAAGITNDSENVEFLIDRNADCAKAAYLSGMKPWRSK